MPRRTPVGSIWCPSDGTVRRAPSPRVFIQCVNGQEPMSYDLWSHGLDGLCHDVHLTAGVDIPHGTDGELVTEYWNTNGRRISIIGNIMSMEV